MRSWKWRRGLTTAGETVGYVINVMSHEAYDGDLEVL